MERNATSPKDLTRLVYEIDMFFSKMVIRRLFAWLNDPNKAGISRAIYDLYHSAPLQHSIAKKLCREIRASNPQPINTVKPSIALHAIYAFYIYVA